jgi:hypothetical protein
LMIFRRDGCVDVVAWNSFLVGSMEGPYWFRTGSPSHRICDRHDASRGRRRSSRKDAGDERKRRLDPLTRGARPLGSLAWWRQIVLILLGVLKSESLQLAFPPALLLVVVPTDRDVVVNAGLASVTRPWDALLMFVPAIHACFVVCSA